MDATNDCFTWKGLFKMRLQKMLYEALKLDYQHLHKAKMDLSYRGHDRQESCCVWLWAGTGEIIDHYAWADISDKPYKVFVEEVVETFRKRRTHETTKS